MKSLSSIFPFLLLFTLSTHASELGTAQQVLKLQQQLPTDTGVAQAMEELKKRPKDPKVHLKLGEVYLERSLYELAIISFHRAIRLESSMAQAHVGLSHAYRKKGLKKLEISEMEMAARKDPKNPKIRYELGVLYMEPDHFDYKKAKKQYKTLKKLTSPLADKLGSLMEIDS